MSRRFLARLAFMAHKRIEYRFGELAVDTRCAVSTVPLLLTITSSALSLNSRKLCLRQLPQLHRQAFAS